MRRIHPWGSLLAVLAALFLSGCGFEIIDTGRRGIEIRFGEVVSDSLPEGLYFYNPLTSNIVEIDTRVQRWDNETETYTKDVQQAKIKYTLNYRLDQKHAHIVFKDVGTDWEQKLIPQVVEGTIKEVIGKWDAVDLISNRDKAQVNAEGLLKGKLNQKNVEVTRFELTDITFTPQFEKSVEEKVIAQQKAIEEQNRTVQIQEQAKQKLIAAEAEAKSIRIRADALSGNPRLVDLEAVNKWDGHLPQYMLGNAVPFVSLPQGR